MCCSLLRIIIIQNPSPVSHRLTVLAVAGSLRPHEKTTSKFGFHKILRGTEFKTRSETTTSTLVDEVHKCGETSFFVLHHLLGLSFLFQNFVPDESKVAFMVGRDRVVLITIPPSPLNPLHPDTSVTTHGRQASSNTKLRIRVS